MFTGYLTLFYGFYSCAFVLCCLLAAFSKRCAESNHKVTKLICLKSARLAVQNSWNRTL